MSLLANFLYMLRKIQPALGPPERVILQGQAKKNYDMKEDRRHQTQAQCGPCRPAPCWGPGNELPRKDHKQDNSGDHGRSDPVGFSFVVQAEEEIHDLDRQKLTQEVFNSRLIALEPPESDGGDHYASHDQRRDHPKDCAQILEEFPGMDAERMLDTTAFMQRLNMEPARLHIPPNHRKRTHSKRKQRCQTLPAEKKMPVWLRPAEEQRKPNQLDHVDELCEETDADGQSQQQPIAHFPGFEGRPRQIRAPSPEKHAQGIYRHQNGSDREQWD